MSEKTYDYIAISDRGVVALHTDDGSADLALWIRGLEAKGYRVERAPVEEAVRRHRAYLATLSSFAGLISASGIEAASGRQDAPAA